MFDVGRVIGKALKSKCELNVNWNGGMYISYIIKTQKQRLLELPCDMKLGLEGASWEGIRNESCSPFGRTMYQRGVGQ